MKEKKGGGSDKLFPGLDRRRQVRLAPSRHTASVEFESNALWTTGPENGLQRWPMHTTPSEVRFDPPTRVELPFPPFRMAVDRNFKFMAFVSESAGRVAAVNLPKNSPTIFDQQSPLASFVAMSFDAKWVATGGWHTDRCRLWNRSAGELAHDWVTGAPTRVKFTPDGRELILSRGSDFTFFNPDTKERTRIFNRELGVWPGDVAFSADGKLMAMEMAPATIHIKEVLTGKTIAQLEDPFGDRSNALQFSNDGTKLIMGSAYPAAIHIWDLPSLKEGLNSAGLDWDGRAPIPSLPEPK